MKLTEVEQILFALGYENCWCSLAIGNPMVYSHSALCLKIQEYFADLEYLEQAKEHPGPPK
jgi:hypothetical protein